MKKSILILLAATLYSVTNAQGLFDKIKKATSKDSSRTITNILKQKVTTKGLSNDEIINGLKEALSIGADSTSKRLNKPDAFFTNAALKISMPDEAKKAESTLRKLGMESVADKAILSMNRAAEDAAGEIATVFMNAIKQMTVTDGLKILNGGDFAATDYLKTTTTTTLTEKMRPIIETSLAKVNATGYWKEVFTTYNKVSFSKTPVNTDLAAFVTERALAGIFLTIGQEEQKIRKDPAAQVTSLLKKVFGN